MRHRDQTIRQRATVIAMTVTGVVAVLVYIGVLALIQYQVADRLSTELTYTTRQVAALARAGHLTNPVIVGGHQLVQVQNDRGQVVAATRSVSGLPALHARRPVDGERIEQRVCVDRRHCLTVVSQRVTGPGQAVIIHSIAPEPGLFPRPGLAVLLALGIPVSIGVGGVWRWWAAGRRLRPIEALRDELDAINAADLRRRVSMPQRRDEFYWLAMAVNATLDRLEAAVEQQRRLVSDVSHDLRSPIAGLRAELEVALIDPEGTDLREALGRTLTNIDRLQNIVTELLALARRDAGLPSRNGPVELGDLAEREVRRVPRRITAKVVTEPGVVVRANRLDISRVLTNLLDNAARHADSEVTVTVRRQGGEAVVEVFNDGKPIPPADRERIFERFIRLPDARQRDPGGSGLGLAISREIAHAHGGTLSLTDNDKGACFVLTLPLLSELSA
ncbi:sensor histidine kinase [Actinoallomurus soli]|uniref:sensor histidine kinase n=1 Tax=Actinoallomurus soli TaxID=2952535 RepID=UPI0020930CBC|nr:HAMP domain-containing sensor histidine kinase [Actinoallomurus soli]MCO5971724.1 HAMP domain-containing histidine kinase [Actinoallomurus soli]